MTRKIQVEDIFYTVAILAWTANLLLFFPAPVIFGLGEFVLTMMLYWVFTLIGTIFPLLGWALSEKPLTISGFIGLLLVLFLLAGVLFPANIDFYDLSARQCEPTETDGVYTCFVSDPANCGWRSYKFKPVIASSVPVYWFVEVVSSDIGYCYE